MEVEIKIIHQLVATVVNGIKKKKRLIVKNRHHHRPQKIKITNQAKKKENRIEFYFTFNKNLNYDVSINLLSLKCEIRN